MRARDAGPESIEAFLAASPDGPRAEAARERLALLRRLAEPPPPVPAGPTAPWIGRRPGETFADALPDGSFGPRMAVAPAGVFQMGCASAAGCRLEELPRHPVRVARPFALSTREVTHAEYFRFASPDKRLDPTWADRPATHLTWVEAAGYAEWLSERAGAAYRLPSEAEWEWAARAGTETAYSWGAEMEGGRARCHECPWPQPSGLDVFGSPLIMTWVTFAGSYAPNGWGFHDMHGNAAEWTADCGGRTTWARRRTARRGRTATARAASSAAALTRRRPTRPARRQGPAGRPASATWTSASGCCANCATRRRGMATEGLDRACRSSRRRTAWVPTMAVETTSAVTLTTTRYLDKLGRVARVETEAFTGARDAHEDVRHDVRSVCVSNAEPATSGCGTANNLPRYRALVVSSCGTGGLNVRRGQSVHPWNDQQPGCPCAYGHHAVSNLLTRT